MYGKEGVRKRSEAVEKLQWKRWGRNTGIGIALDLNLCRSARRHHESLLRRTAPKIVFQQTQLFSVQLTLDNFELLTLVSECPLLAISGHPVAS